MFDLKAHEQKEAIKFRKKGESINDIAQILGVAKSSVSVWVRDIELTSQQFKKLGSKGHSRMVIEKRRTTRLKNEAAKREKVINKASSQIDSISERELWLIGVMLYWAEGGKTQRMVRFSNGDPEMIKIMMKFFREICDVPEDKFRGYIHIHPHLDYVGAENYWASVSKISVGQFFKTYRKKNVSSKGKKNTLPYGVFDIYIMDTMLFLKIQGWAKGIFEQT